MNNTCYTSWLNWIRFPIGGKRVTCRGSKLTDSQGKQQRELSTRTWSGRAPWNCGKFISQPRRANDFFAVFFSNFELRGITKHFRLGKHWGSRGNKTLCFPWGQSLSAYWTLPENWSSGNSPSLLAYRSIMLLHHCLYTRVLSIECVMRKKWILFYDGIHFVHLLFAPHHVMPCYGRLWINHPGTCLEKVVTARDFNKPTNLWHGFHWFLHELEAIYVQ